MTHNLVKVNYQFDIETNEELWLRLNLTEGEVLEMLEDEDDAARLHSLCCGETGAAEFVNLDLFFDNPTEATDDEITDAISDEYGWLINSWEKHSV